MRVVVPYTRIHHLVVDAILKSGHTPQMVNVAGDDTAYWRLLNQLWAAGETFTIVEHDVIVQPDTLDLLESCPNVWCSCPVHYYSGPHAGLGCTRFRADLIARHPDAIQRVAQRQDATHPPMHWCRVDGYLRGVLMGAGETQCEHGPPLEHLRDGNPDRVLPAHGCIV